MKLIRMLLFLVLIIIVIPTVIAKNTTIEGVVLDSLENLVEGAKLKVNCMNRELISDEFGSFEIENIPLGNCRIYASYKNSIGFEDTNLTENQTVNLKIKLDKTIIHIKKDKTESVPYLITAAIAFIIILLIENNKKRRTIKKERDTKTPKQKNLMINILKTLNEKERKIVEFLLEKNNKSMQSTIRHGTSIPRTSLTRTLKNLETKNIVKINREGKTVKVELTDWFLDNE